MSGLVRQGATLYPLHMAKALNGYRVWLSRLLIAATVVIVLFLRPTFADGDPLHELFDLAGILLVALCALGRVYTTAFLGGHKNKTLITYGPFSLVRNPLYVFSMIGVTGIGLMSNNIGIMIALPLLFLILYIDLVGREEKFLKQNFGEEYVAYCRAVPRFLPNFRSYAAPETVPMSPRLLWVAFRDATVWFIPYEIFELVEFLQRSGLVPVLN